MPVRGGWAATGIGGKLRVGWTFGLDLLSAYSTPPRLNAIDRNSYGLNVRGPSFPCLRFVAGRKWQRAHESTWGCPAPVCSATVTDGSNSGDAGIRRCARRTQLVRGGG